MFLGVYRGDCMPTYYVKVDFTPSARFVPCSERGSQLPSEVLTFNDVPLRSLNGYFWTGSVLTTNTTFWNQTTPAPGSGCGFVQDGFGNWVDHGGSYAMLVNARIVESTTELRPDMVDQTGALISYGPYEPVTLPSVGQTMERGIVDYAWIQVNAPGPVAIDDTYTAPTYQVGQVFMNVLGNDQPANDPTLVVDPDTITTAEYQISVAQNGDVMVNWATMMPETLSFDYTLRDSNDYTDTGTVQINIPPCADILNFQTHRQAISVVSSHLAQVDAEIAGTRQLIASMDSVNYSSVAFSAMMWYQWAADTFATIVSAFTPVGAAFIGSATAVRDYFQSGGQTAAAGLAVNLLNAVVGSYAKWVSAMDKIDKYVDLFFFSAQQTYNSVSGDYASAQAAAASIRSFVDQQSATLAELQTYRTEIEQGLTALETHIATMDCREIENKALLDGASSILAGFSPAPSFQIPGFDPATATAAFNAFNTPATSAQTITPANSSSTIVTSAQADSISTGGGNDIVMAQAGDDTVDLGAGNDVALAGAGNDMVQAGLGNDDVQGQTGNDTLLGGGGHDTLSGNEGNDILKAEAQDTTFDAGSASILRLYQATLNRLPDQTGHLGWTGQLTGGAALNQIAAGFVNSAEFQASYSNTSNTEFVDLLYQNVLNRAADAAGSAAWTRQLDSGIRTREEVVVGFSESPEFQNNTATQSLEFSRAAYQAAWGDDVYRVYQATLGRQPDVPGFEAWTSQLANGQSLNTVVQGFVASSEFQALYGALDNTEFLTLLYQNVLNRTPDDAGLAGWQANMATGTTRESVVIGFSQSSEFQQATTPQYEAWMEASAVDDDLNGGAGDDVLFGGQGADTFRFNFSDGGQDTVAGFELWDTIVLEGFAFADTTQARDAFVQDETDSVLTYDNGEIRLLNTPLSDLSADEFILT